MMKVLFIHYAIIDKQGFGRTFNLAKEIAQLGNEVILITTQPFNKFVFPFQSEVRNNVNIISFPDILPDNFRRTGFGFLSSFLKFLYILKNHKFDIVHSDTGHRPSAAIPAFTAQILFRIPHVIEWWDYFGRGGQFDEKSFFKKITFGYYDLTMQKPLLKLANGVIVLSDYLMKMSLKMGIQENKLIVLNGGADVEGINYYTDNNFLKKKHGISENSLTLGFVGMNSGELKDLEPFMLAVNELKFQIEINWFTTGEIISDENKRKYQIGAELKEFGWQDYKIFAETIGCADVFLLLQKDNIMNAARWPNKIGDYLAAGRLILTNPAGEVTTLLHKFPNIFIKAENEVNQLVQILKEINLKKLNILERGNDVRKVAEKSLSWNSRAVELHAFYNKIINSPKSH